MKKKNKTQNYPLPMKKLKDFENKYPNVFNLAEDLRTLPPDDEIGLWDRDLVYLPISGCNAVMNSYKVLSGSPEVQLLAALAAWKQSKQIFQFAEELSDELMMQSNEDLLIPVAVLKNMPFPCVYIKLQNQDVDGFFVYWEQDLSKGLYFELRMLLMADGKMNNFPLILHLTDCDTIADGVKASARQIKKSLGAASAFASAANTICSQYVSFAIERISKYLQLLLYLCAENADIVEQSNITTQKKEEKSNSSVQKPNKHKVAQVWDVGYVIKKQLKAYKQNDSSSSVVGDESKKRPHMRKGHYHHFWVGKKDGSNRRLILKWVHPILVGADNSDEVITTINEVNK